MKTSEKTTATKRDCDVSTCLECSLCKAINYEEKRSVSLQSKNEIKALYGAEATSYYFYFSTVIKRPQILANGKQLV